LKQSGFSNVKGVDVSREQTELAHRFGVPEAECGDLFSFLRANEAAFDIVFSMDILEHFERPELFDVLALLRRSMKADGRLIIHVPNGEGLFGMRIRYGDLTHENCFTSQSIRQALVTSGFGEVDCFEEKPVVHGVFSLVRRMLWDGLTLFPRLLLLAETGRMKHVLSQNMLVIARRSKDSPHESISRLGG
jgi:hypothetical protein